MYVAIGLLGAQRQCCRSVCRSDASRNEDIYETHTHTHRLVKASSSMIDYDLRYMVLKYHSTFIKGEYPERKKQPIACKWLLLSTNKYHSRLTGTT